MTANGIQSHAVPTRDVLWNVGRRNPCRSNSWFVKLK